MGSINILRNGKINLERNLEKKKIYVKNFEKKKRKKEIIAGCTFRNLEVYSLSCNVPLGLWTLHWPIQASESLQMTKKKKALDCTFW